MKKIIVILFLLMIPGCSSIMPQQDSCFLVQSMTNAYTITMSDSLENKEDIQQIVEGINSSLKMTKDSLSDSTAIEILDIVQCAIEGVIEGLE